MGRSGQAIAKFSNALPISWEQSATAAIALPGKAREKFNGYFFGPMPTVAA
ncbi:MAG: hypothetical protein HC925_05825 [Coleofasciculaceae cyanobacterium SM2_3_26]|nr:hypothetical protein [Coleofasciculaceae cyanobacterium SM2_3_26]